jgi:hypothetical protein
VLNVDFWRREHRSMAASTTGGGGDSITQGRKAWTHFTSVWAMFESGSLAYGTRDWPWCSRAWMNQTQRGRMNQRQNALRIGSLLSRNRYR